MQPHAPLVNSIVRDTVVVLQDLESLAVRHVAAHTQEPSLSDPVVGNAQALRPTLAARGADPAITIPAGGHFFRRVNNITLAPIAGALIAVPNHPRPQSLVEGVYLPALTTVRTSNGVAAVEDLEFVVVGILPTKIEVVLVQLEAEPPGTV